MTAPVRSQYDHDRFEQADAETSVLEFETDDDIRFEWVGEVLVVRPLGGLDRAAVDGLRCIIQLATAVILDLDQCVLIDPMALSEMDTGDDVHPVHVCIVSRRLTCRRLLVRLGIADRFAVFERLEDALCARKSAPEQEWPQLEYPMIITSGAASSALEQQPRHAAVPLKERPGDSSSEPGRSSGAPMPAEHGTGGRRRLQGSRTPPSQASVSVAGRTVVGGPALAGLR